MKTGKDLIERAKKYIGAKYVLGVIAPKDNPNWKGPFDCAEFISYLICQETGKVYGCASNNSKPAVADAWTNFFKRDGDANVLKEIPVEDAINTEGAILLRYTAEGSMGHIVLSDGKGGTVEAHSTKRGCIESTALGRRWDVGLLVPDIEYSPSAKPVSETQPATIYRATVPMMVGDIVKKIQVALKAKGFDPNGVDGKFGNGTAMAVKAFQLSEGLVPDGEVGTDTLKELGVDC